MRARRRTQHDDIGVGSAKTIELYGCCGDDVQSFSNDWSASLRIAEDGTLEVATNRAYVIDSTPYPRRCCTGVMDGRNGRALPYALVEDFL